MSEEQDAMTSVRWRQATEIFVDLCDCYPAGVLALLSGLLVEHLIMRQATSPQDALDGVAFFTNHAYPVFTHDR